MAKRKRNETRRAVTVAALCEVMAEIAPLWAAEDWDNVGLLVGARSWPAKRILLTIDMTASVLDEAIRNRCDAIVSYHPPIFRASKRMVPDRTRQEGLAAEALSRKIALYSPHTALDSADGGANDTLAKLAGLSNLTPFETKITESAQCKLVVFVPPAHVGPVAEAAFAAGAGRIGDYEQCSFQLHGKGTFFGTESTDPVVGKRGRLEQVEEIRLEVILPTRQLADVTAAVRQSHPYEEPAFDLYPLVNIPDTKIGQGRLGEFETPQSLAKLAKALAEKTGAANVVTVGKPAKKLNRGLAYVGAAGDNPFKCRKDRFGCEGDVVITGEISHHNALQYERRGIAAIALGHWASERPMLKPLASRLKKALKGTSITISRTDRDPFS